MNKHPRVCVVGSINMDMVTTTKKMPKQGETVLGESFKTYPGGKGANQAIAAARLGANVSIIGAVGDDTFGRSLLTHFQSEGIDQEGIQVIPNISTGIATIILSENDNRILVSSGANAKLTPEIVNDSHELLLASDVILLQFEIPMETVQFTVDFAYKHQIPVIINPAPFHEIPEDILKKVTYLTPNEVEFLSMTNMPLFESIKNKMIVTKGEQGVQFVASSGVLETIPAYQVHVKDTTGAGDTFNGALATELGRTKSIDESVHFANAAAALSIGRLGAQGGMPMRKDVTRFIEKVKA
ncbi:ribokinase [Virgibacillus halotolerans]|uniref:ribokinase n=1 Tax=Virgibacillus halotolerans TaxID=1071053 RepID=UPI0019601A45|nr:ribokinase [Virgibacillus halotolerans]MBM7598985.1 ribokinase [Virgibacillus halotolerans]